MFQVMELRKIGGRDTRSTVYRLLPRIMSDTLAMEFSWTGAKGKRMFRSLTLWKVIQG
jgi:hypothetical protein